MRFENKVLIITGAASGIGATTAELFAHEGAAVVLVDLNDPAPVVDTIVKAGGRAKAIQGSVDSIDVLTKAVDTAVNDFGGIDVLINNAGTGLPPGPIEHATAEGWDTVFSVNVKAGFLATKLALPHLRKTRGSVLFTSSIAGIQAGCNMAPYAASKAAVISMMKSMALDHAPEGIRFNAVCPGATDTPILRSVGDVDLFAQNLPTKKIVHTDEIAEAFAYLASHAARSITGQTLVIDGGYTAGDFRLLPSVFEK